MLDEILCGVTSANLADMTDAAAKRKLILNYLIAFVWHNFTRAASL